MVVLKFSLFFFSTFISIPYHLQFSIPNFYRDKSASSGRNNIDICVALTNVCISPSKYGQFITDSIRGVYVIG